jgi:alpha-beta hydrolase superfamily lysophospholipase
VLLCLVLGAAVPLVAQQPDAGVFRLFQGQQEIGREVFRDDGATLTSTVTIPLLRTKIATTLTRSGAHATHAEIRALDIGTDTLVRAYTATVDGDSVRLSLTPAHGDARRWAKAATLDEISAEQSIAGFTSLIQRSARQNHDYAVWLPSADSALRTRLIFFGDSVEMFVGRQQMFALLGPDGRVRLLEVPASRVRFVRATGDSLPPLPGMTPPVPDYSAAAGASYTAEEVRVPVRPAAGDTFSLGCTLTKPRSGGPRFPAAVTLTGSGQQDRDENLYPLVSEYHLFRQVAERLALAGIAVLRCDDRGFGASGGPLDSATMVDFAHDAEAKLAWLRARADINPAKLGIIGHSEGGIVGPMVAAEDPRLAALVMLAGTGKTMDAVVRDQFLYPAEHAEGLTPAQRDTARVEALRAADAFISRPLPYLRQARDYDPLVTARRVRTPVLVLNGALDRQVSAGQADTLGAAFREGGNRDVTVRVFPGLNHLFVVSPSGTGATDEYASLRDVAVTAEVLDLIATWLSARLR